MSESRNRLSRVLSATVLIGLALTGAAPSASAETDRYAPRIECGPEAPKGKRLHRGKAHTEIESDIKEARTARSTGETYFMVQRYALIKRSDCWVSFWVYQDDRSSERPFQRATGTFYEVENYEKYWNQATAYRHFGATVSAERAGELLAMADPEAAVCQKKRVKVFNSLPGTPLDKASQEISEKAELEYRSCIFRRAKAVDKIGFLGIWNDEETYRTLFAYRDGTIYTINLDRVEP